MQPNKSNIRLNEYKPSGYDNMPDVIKLYHGTSMYELDEIIDCGVISAIRGKQHGETYGVNWFSVDLSGNFGTGTYFSIEVPKPDFDNGLFRFMNNSDVTSEENEIPIDRYNLKIEKLSGLNMEFYKRIYVKCNEDLYDWLNYLNHHVREFQEGAYFITSPIILKLIGQLFGDDPLRKEGLMESKKQINEYLQDRGIDLYRYLQQWENATVYDKLEDLYNYVPYAFREYFNEKDIDVDYDNEVDTIQYMEWHEDAMYDFMDNIGDYCDYVDLPTWYFMHLSKNPLVKNEWLVHFSDASDQISQQGFIYGTQDNGKLGLTTKTDKDLGGYNFAFRLTEKDMNRLEYGQDAVIFRASGVEVYHVNDEENQVIFDGSTARDFVYVRKNDKTKNLEIFDLKTKRLLYSGKTIYDVINWFLNNNRQYAKRIMSNTQDKNESINEVDSDELSLSSFKPKPDLNPKFWVDEKLNSRVRERLLDIAYDFIDEIALKNFKEDDIVFTGSLANYNWSKYSDIDVHIIVSFKSIYKNVDFVDDYFKSKKELWNEQHKALKIYGFPVEISIEDKDNPGVSTGVYSLVKNKWVKEPVDFDDAKLNGESIKEKAARMMTEIDEIEEKIDGNPSNSKLEEYGEKVQKMFKKLKNLRKEGLARTGEMSSGNVLYKLMRRMGYIDKIWDIVNNTYNRVNSIK